MPPIFPEGIAKKTIDAMNTALRSGAPQYGSRVRKSALQIAAKALGISAPTLRHRLEISEDRFKLAPDYKLEKPQELGVPDGFMVKGVSTLYDSATGEPKIEWVKLQADAERQEEMFREAVAALTEQIVPAKPRPAPIHTSDTLMACYPVGDHHIGMLSWHEETGADYDIAIAEELLSGAIQHLVKAVPKCDTATVVFLGDTLHYDSLEAVTPTSKNLLDADGRFPKMVRATIRAVRHTIDCALSHHQHVRVIIEPGNHDPSSSIFLMELMAALYEKEPRVAIDTAPTRFHYFRHGKCLVGTHHGDKRIKMAELPLIMATDRADDWGKSLFRYIWTGHVHHDQTKDYHGCKVESMRVLAAPDAYAASSGYRSARDMKAIVLHKEFGEVQRVTVNPDMLK